MPGVAGAAAIAGVASIAGGLLSSSGAKKAAQAQAAQQQQALALQQQQFAQTTQNLAPFLQAGQGAIPGLVQGSTAQGLDQRLQDIFSGGQFQNLIGERTRAAQGGLSAAGLRRSGAGLQAIAGIPSQLGLQLEGLLSGRLQNLAGAGQNAAVQQGGFGQNFAQQQSQLLQNLGQTQSQGILGQAQADTARNEALIQGLGQLTGAGIGFASQSPGTDQQTQQVAQQVANQFLPQQQIGLPGVSSVPVFPVG